MTAIPTIKVTDGEQVVTINTSELAEWEKRGFKRDEWRIDGAPETPESHLERNVPSIPPFQETPTRAELPKAKRGRPKKN